LLKAGAETDKENVDGRRAIDMAPDAKVCSKPRISNTRNLTSLAGSELCNARSRKGRH
jgi:hypothetical protein